MEYLRSLGSAAASSILQKSGLSLPFWLGEKIDSRGIWTLHDATKRVCQALPAKMAYILQDDSSQISVFVFDVAKHKSLLPLAKNTLRKLRTIRHPDVLKFVDAVETDSTIYIATERVKPLHTVMEAWSDKPAKAREEWLIWGLHRITVCMWQRGSVSHSHLPGRRRVYQRVCILNSRSTSCRFCFHFAFWRVETGRI